LLLPQTKREGKRKPRRRFLKFFSFGEEESCPVRSKKLNNHGGEECMTGNRARKRSNGEQKKGTATCLGSYIIPKKKKRLLGRKRGRWEESMKCQGSEKKAAFCTLCEDGQPDPYSKAGGRKRDPCRKKLYRRRKKKTYARGTFQKRQEVDGASSRREEER